MTRSEFGAGFSCGRAMRSGVAVSVMVRLFRRSGKRSFARSLPVAEPGQGSLLGEDVRRVAPAFPRGYLPPARIENGIRPGLCQAEAFALIAELIGEAHISSRGHGSGC